MLLYIVGAIVVFLGISAFFGAPYVPSRRRDLQPMFDTLYPLTAKDTVLDIGSGDGLVLREVSRRKAKAVGYEIHPFFVVVSKLLSARYKNVTIKWANAWKAPFPDDVTLVYIFSVGRDAKKLDRKVQEEVNRLGRAVSLVCYGNPLPNRKANKTLGAYYLYKFEPLHLSKA